METTPAPPVNGRAVLSLAAALLTALSFCIGFAPIPLTALVCYPAAALSGIVSLLAGARALREIRASGEEGRVLALIGLWVSGITLAAVTCSVTLTALAIPHIIDLIRKM
ncbi:MAG TPA: hypothetical protein VIV15_13530 [Anaerolineales bacterium]